MDFDLKTDDSPAFRKSKPFTKEETNVLLREAKARKHVIHGAKGVPLSVHEMRKAWDEIASIVSTIEGITRTRNKCKRRYQNVQQGWKKKIAAFKNSRTNVVKTPDSTVTSEDKFVEFGGLQGALKEESEEHLADVDQVSAGHGAELFEEYSVEPSTEVQAAPTSRRSNSLNSLPPEELPFLETQQNGFNSLERELLGVRQSISSLNTRLNRVEVLLRPIGHIAESLGRITTAVERLSTQ